jgi:hypothetical protein
VTAMQIERIETMALTVADVTRAIAFDEIVLSMEPISFARARFHRRAQVPFPQSVALGDEIERAAGLHILGHRWWTVDEVLTTDNSLCARTPHEGWPDSLADGPCTPGGQQRHALRGSASISFTAPGGPYGRG